MLMCEQRSRAKSPGRYDGVQRGGVGYRQSYSRNASEETIGYGSRNRNTDALNRNLAQRLQLHRFMYGRDDGWPEPVKWICYCCHLPISSFRQTKMSKI
ncbi:hypothetical protein RRF57_009780 [Xylaria bambusicola]|uniref:Uncharacterized protein n=1 Tax=Xylaria bambusicola TaxID=326684 RepID=A0AAN7UW69_9PEZI